MKGHLWRMSHHRCGWIWVSGRERGLCCVAPAGCQQSATGSCDKGKMRSLSDAIDPASHWFAHRVGSAPSCGFVLTKRMKPTSGKAKRRCGSSLRTRATRQGASSRLAPSTVPCCPARARRNLWTRSLPCAVGAYCSRTTALSFASLRTSRATNHVPVVPSAQLCPRLGARSEISGFAVAPGAPSTAGRFSKITLF